MASADSLSPNKPSSAWKSNLMVWGGLSIALLVVLYWNYTTFIGPGLFSADTNSPDCIKVMATVTDVHESGNHSAKSKTTYHVTYEYKVDGVSYSEAEQISFNVYNRTHLGEPLEVCYMKGNPARSGVIGNDMSGDMGLYVVIADVATIVVIIMLIRDWLKRRRKAAALT